MALFTLRECSWRPIRTRPELGRAVASHDPSDPFNPARASLPETTFIILQAPAHPAIGDVSRWSGPGRDRLGRAWPAWSSPRLPQQTTAGVLHYKVIFRAFLEGADPLEAKKIGHVRIDVREATTLRHAFDEALQLPDGAEFTARDRHVVAGGRRFAPLELMSVPEPLA